MWTEEQSNRAEQEHWKLVTVIDEGTTHPYLMVATTLPGTHTDKAALQFVMEQAKGGSKLCMNALQACALSRLPTKTQAKRSRK